jgi:capsular exopolysaccharide synthesis family protein
LETHNNIQQENLKWDLKAIIQIAIRNWYYFGVAFLISYSASYLYLRYSQPIYNVKSTILIKDEKNKASNSQEIISSLELFDQIRNIQNEIEILRSYQMIHKALQELDFEVSYFVKGKIKEGELYQKFPVTVKLDSSQFQLRGIPFYINILSDSTYSIYLNSTDKNIESLFKEEGSSSFEIQGILGLPIKTKFFNLIVNKSKHFSRNYNHEELYFIINDLGKLTEEYVSKLDIQLTNKNSSVLSLQVSGPVIEKEIAFLNKLGEVYIQSGLDEKNQIAINTINFIDQQLFEITDSLKGAENQLESFRKAEKVMNLSYAADNAFNQLDKLEEEKASYVVKDKYYRYLLEYIKNNHEINKLVAPSTIGIHDPLLNKLVADLYTLNSEQASLKFSAKEKNPSFEILELKIENTKKALLENVNNLIQSSNIALADIDIRIAKIKEVINKLPRTERNLVNIQRKFNLNDHIYNFLLEKRAEAGLAKAANTPDNKIIDKAMLFGKNPVFPNKKKIWIISFFMSIIIPSLLIFLKNYLNDTIKSKESIEKYSGVPVLGIIGHYPKNSAFPIIESPKSFVSESFRSLRINLQYLNINKKSKIIGISSSISGEGKTFFALNLAASIAITGEKVILIGADLRKPKLNINLDISNEIGLSTYLINKSSLTEIIKNTQVENLDVITSGPVPPNPTELLGTSRVEEMFTELSKTYDYIVIDAPPLGLVADYYLLSKFTDANLFLVRQNYTKVNMLNELRDLYKNKKLLNLFVVFNDLRRSHGGYGYGYGYEYGYGYYEESEERKGAFHHIKKFLRK